MDNVKEYIDESFKVYADAIATHAKQVAQMTKEYEDMVADATKRMEAMSATAPAPVVMAPAVVQIQTEEGETLFVFNQAALDQNNMIMDSMLDILQSI